MERSIVDRAIPVLERTPEALRALLAGAPDDLLFADEGPDTFCPYDVVSHLIHGEETDWIPRLRIILEHADAVAFEPFDRFAFRERGREQPIAALLDSFAALRAKNLDVLRGAALTPEQLRRPGTHPELGPVTLGALIAAWAVHDLGHLGQVVRVVAKRFSPDVGPWREYSPILTRY